MTLDFKNEGDLIYLIGESQNDTSSEYLAKHHKITASPAHILIWKRIRNASGYQAIDTGETHLSAHDVSDEGLYCWQASMPQKLGFDIHTDDEIRKMHFFWRGQGG